MASFASPFGFERVANFRLVAPTAALADGRQLKANLLYRTGQLNMATKADVRRLRELPVKTYVDLRLPAQEPPAGLAFEYLALDGWSMRPGEPRRLSCSISEGVQPEPGLRDRLPELAEDDPVKAFWDEWTVVEDDGTRRFVSIHGGERDATPEATTRFLLGYNACCMRRNGAEILKAMRALTDPDNYPLAFGCVTGKDRTGFIAALVLGVLGASREDIIADYLESNAHLGHNIHVLDAAAASMGHAVAPPSAHRRTALEVTRGVMEGTLALIDRHGGFRGYLASIGFGAEDVNALISVLTEPGARL